MTKRLLYGFVSLMALAVPLTGFRGSVKPVSVSAKPTTTRDVNARASTANGLENPVENAPLKLPLEKPRIVVWKAERKLLLYSNERVVRTYHVGLGLSPIGDKVRQGDHRTPEGEFYIFTKNAKSAFYLSLGVSYPNLAHAKRGLRDDLITKAQYDQITEAIGQKKIPLQRTNLGGDIYIHGHGSQADWTWGCVALENEDIKELYDAVAVGTPVRIEP